MEDQTITTTTKPRVTLKYSSLKKYRVWEMASSNSKDKEELLKITDMLKEVDDHMTEIFPNPKGKVKKE